MCLISQNGILISFETKILYAYLVFRVNYKYHCANQSKIMFIYL